MQFLSNLLTDLRFTARLFSRSPGFSVVAILSFALGIGASSAIFSLIQAVLIDPFPYRDANTILSPTFSSRAGANQGRIWYTIPDYLALRQSARTIADAFLADNTVLVTTGGFAERVKAIAFSPNTFDFLGVPALLGRTFRPGDIPAPQAPPRLAVISYLFWQRHFSADPGIPGKSLELNHQLYTILGVMPPRFAWSDADIYVPLAMAPDSRKAIPMMLRARPAFSLEAVNAELQTFTEGFARQSPTLYPREFHLHVQRLNDWLLGRFKGTLWILMIAVGFLLLIACGNVSILLLARASARRKEVGVRVSLGASRRRVLQQLLTESVVLALAGGLVGVLLAYRGVPAIIALMPEYSVPHEAVIRVNGAVVLFTFAISILTGIVFGMAPALQLVKPDVRESMQEGGRAVAGGGRAGKTRNLLIVSEVALTVILLVGAIIAIRGFIALTETRLGYDPSNVLTMSLQTREGAYQTWQTRGAFYQRILDKLRETPGVQSVGATITAMPPWIVWNTQVEIAGLAKEANEMALVGLVGGDYFSTIHVPLLRGRVFSREDFQRPEAVAVINEEMLRRYWPDGRDPIGLTIRIPELNFKGNPQILGPPGEGERVQIIGVVATVRNQGLQESSKPAIYVPFTLALSPNCVFMIRTAGDPHRLAKALREQLRVVDPEQPVNDVMTMNEWFARWDSAYPRFSTALFSIFAGVGLLLAAMGLYSVVSYVVSRRTHEFGLRMALGASETDVLGLVAGTTARLVLGGFLIGLAGSLALGSVIAHYVSGWNPRDPVAYLAVSGILLAVAAIATFVPARRAIAIQPMVALRHE
jgi:predicted permease